MKAKNIIIIHPQSDEQLNIIKAFMNALKIKFEISDKSFYDSDFVNKIKKSQKEFEKGEFIAVNKDELRNFLGLDK